MAQTSNVEINIGSKLDAKGFKQAETALSKMGKSAKNLAAAFGVTFAAKQLINYSQASARAAAQDQKSQVLLANSLNNLGLAYAKVDVEGFISKLEAQTAIADNVLRPSFAQLSQVTGSVAKSQELMQLAFDASAGSGLDYSQTIDILSQAYVGNYKGLKQLNLGLTQAEMKSMSFQQIQDKIKATFAGAGGKSLETYQGQMDKLAISTGNASEKIGYALLNSIVKISGSKTIDGFTAKIDALSTAFANLITRISDYIAVSTGQQARAAFSGERVVAGGKIVFKNPSTGAGNLQLTGGSNMDTQKSQIAAKKKAEKEALARQKELNALLLITNKDTKEKLLLTAGQKALDELKRMFDLKGIEIQAALNGTISEEDRLRLLGLQALNDGNEAQALLALAALNASKKISEMSESLKQWADFQKMIGDAFKNAGQGAGTGGGGTMTSPSPFIPPAYIPGQGTTPGQTGIPGLGGGGLTPGFGMGGWVMPSAASSSPTVVVNVAGSVTTQQDLVSAITQGIYNNQASGIPISYSISYT